MKGITLKQLIGKLHKILQERDLPPYPDAVKEAGVGYTDYLTGAGARAKGVRFSTDPTTGEDYVYTPARNRQCSIGWHGECTDPTGDECGCPCHQIEKLLRDQRRVIDELRRALSNNIALAKGIWHAPDTAAHQEVRDDARKIVDDSRATLEGVAVRRTDP